MLSNGEVARRFANGCTSGSSQHVFIDGDRIYSYGRHFLYCEKSEWSGSADHEDL